MTVIKEIFKKSYRDDFLKFRYDCIDITEHCVETVNDRLKVDTYYKSFMNPTDPDPNNSIKIKYTRM